MVKKSGLSYVRISIILQANDHHVHPDNKDFVRGSDSLQ